MQHSKFSTFITRQTRSSFASNTTAYSSPTSAKLRWARPAQNSLPTNYKNISVVGRSTEFTLLLFLVVSLLI